MLNESSEMVRAFNIASPYIRHSLQALVGLMGALRDSTEHRRSEEMVYSTELNLSGSGDFKITPLCWRVLVEQHGDGFSVASIGCW